MARKKCDYCGRYHNASSECGPDKQCSICSDKLPATTEFFPPHHTGLGGLKPYCRGCSTAKRRKRDEKNAAKIAAAKLFYYSGITMEQYEKLLADQGGVCAICGQPEPTGRRLSVDHDHACCPGDRACGKCVRGLLCSDHNMGLGWFKDSESNLIAAASYLAAWRAGNRELRA